MPYSSGSHFALMAELAERHRSRQEQNLSRLRANIASLDHVAQAFDPSIPSEPIRSTPTTTPTRDDDDHAAEALIRSFLPPRATDGGGEYGRSVLGNVLASYLRR